MFICTKCCKLLGVRSVGSKFLFSALKLLSSNYYDILGVSKDAGSSEIKMAYFELSKALHPDMNPDNPVNQHDRFIELNTAYSVLIKPLQRREYDNSLAAGRPFHSASRVYRSTGPNEPFSYEGGHRGWYQDFDVRSRRGPIDPNSYYGIKGVKRVGNIYILYGCIFLLVFSGMIHFIVFKQSSDYATRLMDAKDRRIAEIYNESKNRLKNNSKEKQMEVMRQRHRDIQKDRRTYILGGQDK